MVVAISGSAKTMSAYDAVSSMDSLFTRLDPNLRDFALPDRVLDAFRGGAYGDYLPLGTIVARSLDGHVFSFIGHDSTITTMFMAASDDMLH